MNILFDKEWRRDDIRDLVYTNKYLKFQKHEDLKGMCICPFCYDEDYAYYEPDYEELLFIVPANWLKNKAKELFEVNDLDSWLQNEYTSDESEIIFENAIKERQVVMIDFS